MERKRDDSTGQIKWKQDDNGCGGGVSRNSLKLGAGSLYLSETWSKRRIIIGGTPRETLSSNFAGDEIPRR